MKVFIPGYGNDVFGTQKKSKPKFHLYSKSSSLSSDSVLDSLLPSAEESIIIIISSSDSAAGTAAAEDCCDAFPLA